MNNNPLVSIIMNCYNGEKYLNEAINSVLKQKYSNWELIFWDNISNDRSAEIFKNYNDPRLKYFCAANHTPLYEARNIAFKKTSGELIAFLDVDDLWTDDKLSKQVILFNNKDIGLVYGNFWFLNQRKGKEKKIYHKKILPKGDLLDTLLKSYLVGLPTVMIRKKSLESLEYNFDQRFNIVGDFDIVIRLAINWKFDCINQPIATYRWHSENESHVAKKHIYELETWYSEMLSHPILSKNENLINVFYKINYMKGMYHAVKGNFINAFKIFLYLPISIEKLKLLVAIILPNIILKRLRT